MCLHIVPEGTRWIQRHQFKNLELEEGDTARMQTEQVKLDVVREVRAEFDRIWEEAE